MKQLSKTQQAVLDQIRNSIAFAKKFDNFKEYWIASEGRSIDAEAKYYLWDIEKTYKKYWINRLNNITLVNCNSRTLKALEAQGYIEIITDGGSYTDTVKLLKE